jgi:tetratricopeptide (TPR) repeat protein
VTPGQRVDPTWLSDRVPGSVAHFLLGERAYRRARFAEAFSHYRQAVDSDSGFALAALKGAQSASWNWRFREAEAFTSTALQSIASMQPRYTFFARGLSDYFAGRADSALSHLSRALAMDPEWLDAWMARGEVLTHLVPGESPLDSLAEFSFEEVTRLDPDFSPALFHLIEIALRKGDARRADTLMHKFRLANTDSLELVRIAEFMLTCVRLSQSAVAWSEEVKRSPNEVFLAAQSLAVGGAQPECARSAWSAVLSEDTATDAWARNRRFNAVLGLQSLAIAEGRDAEARALLERAELSEDQVAAFYILDATAGADVANRAEEAARRFREYYASGSAPSGPYGLFLWFLGVWEAHQGDGYSLQLIADSLSAIAERRGKRRDILLAKSLRARVALAQRDSTAALKLLQELAPTKRRRDPWYPWESLGADHLTLAEIFLARGDYTRALSVAANFDAPARPAADLVYLPASLSVRLRAARALGDRAAARHYRARLAMLGREDLASR